MESDLKNIQSAKQQVEHTVSASKELQSIVSKYVASLESLLSNVKGLVDEISSFQSSNITGVEESIKKIMSSCDKVIKSFATSTDELSADLKNKFGDELGKFESANSKLISQVDKLLGLDEHLKSTTISVNAVKEKLGEVLKELKESQKTQDDSLEAIKKVQGSLSSKIDDILDSCNNLSRALGVVSTDIKSMTDSIMESTKEIGQVKNDCADYTKQIKSEIDALGGKMDFLQKQIESSAQAVKKDVNVNRWIIIAGVVVLTVLIIVCK